MSKKVRCIFTYGLPGSGKDSQLARMGEIFVNTARVQGGEIYRGATNGVGPYAIYRDYFRNNQENKRFRFTENDPMNTIIGLEMRHAIEAGHTTILFTSYPRSLGHLHALDSHLHQLRQEGIDIEEDHLFYFTLEDTSMQRIADRRKKALEELRAAREEGRPPKFFIRHEDLDPQGIRGRFEKFYQHTSPVIVELAVQDRLQWIHAQQPEDIVFQRTMESLSEMKRSSLERI